MPPARVAVESKTSVLLSPEENQNVFRLLGARCQSISTGVVQLFVTHPPYHSQWFKKDTGVLCFVKDNFRKNYFFRLYCIKRNQMIWEHEMYNHMEYIATMPYLHTFEAEDYLIAFNFAEVSEARDMKNMVDSKILAKRRREERKVKNTRQISLEEPNIVPNFKIANNTDVPVKAKYIDPATKKAKRKRNITKADISNPSAFRHISHVGWDPNKGFDVNTEDAQLTEFFKKAGVSETELRDTETRKFIYDFIAANGVREAVATEQRQQQQKRPPPAVPSPVTGPPVPPRGATRSSHSRAAPPPPPTNTAPARPPPTTPRNPPQAINNHVVPPPPSGHAPAPPPPPPPLPPLDIPVSPPPPPAMEKMSNQNNQMPFAVDMRSALMESIREGTTLRPVEEKKPVEADPRGDLLSEIRKGFQLKPCNEREVKPVSPYTDTASDLAGALARALAERNRFIHSEDDSTSDTESDNDDEWDV